MKLFSRYVSRPWLRLDYSDLRTRLFNVFENPTYAQDKLLTDHLTELAAWAQQQGQLELSNRNQKLLEDIDVVQAKVKQLEGDNAGLKEENAEQLKQLQALKQQNVKLTQEIQGIAEKIID